MGTFSMLWKGRQSAAPKNYTQELGWTNHRNTDSTVYTGYYRAAPGVRYHGCVVEDDNGGRRFYILKPPMEFLRATDYAGCFHARKDDWWLISFKPYDSPADVASGIAAIHKALRKAFDVRFAKRRAERS